MERTAMTSPTRSVAKREYKKRLVQTAAGQLLRWVVVVTLECGHELPFLAAVEPPHRVKCPDCGKMGWTA